jgi:two-component system LytT family response regulator
MKRLISRLSSTEHSTRDESIVVTTSRGATVLQVSEIDWIEAAGNYVQLGIGPRKYFFRESLQLLEERLRKYGFIRAHRCALVRLDRVRELIRTDAGALFAMLDCGARIPISRRRGAEFAAAVRHLGRIRMTD